MTSAGHHSMMQTASQGKPYSCRVEWLESNGPQYIWTGLPIINNTGYQVEIEYCFLTFPTGTYAESWVFGYWNNQPNARMYLAGLYKNYLRCGAGPDSSSHYCSLNRNTNFHVAKILNDGAYFDGVRKCPTALDQLPDPIYDMTSVPLFKSWHVDQGGTRRVKYCKMRSIAGELLRDFIMVVDFNGVACVYDRVTNRLFYNDGTGVFTPGPQILE